MLTIDNNVVFEQIINKSRFICYLFSIKTLDEAYSFLSEIRKKHSDANHNCYAYIIGDNGAIAKNSDDKEPSKTAGIVIYDVLKKNNLTNVLAIVTRYFGGIKLGAGGLIRAYSSSVAKALEGTKFITIEKFIRVNLKYDYLFHNQIEKVINNCQIIKKDFSLDIELDILINEKDKTNLFATLINLTNNQIKISVFDTN